MIVPSGAMRRELRVGKLSRWRVVSLLLTVALFFAVAWIFWVYGQIRYYAENDQARPADAIAVFGAAEYDGRPSPVLRARLAHGLLLYQEKLAPVVITLGGGERGEEHSEGGVGGEYMLAHGIPESAVITETNSRDTRESAEQLALIAKVNGLKRIVVVSDGTHLFRIHAVCEHEGLTVYTSPRPVMVPLPRDVAMKRLAHEIASYTLWRLGVLR